MFLFPITLFAQQRVDVTGKTLVVSNNGEGQEVLPYTNILVLEAGDSTLVKGVMSDAGGNFRLSFHAKKESPYLLKVSYIGMKPEFRALNTGKTKIHVGNIVLTEGLELSEVVVTAPIKEVELVGDTTVINADAYRIPEGSNLEELVKKIPGLEYDRQNKTLVYNGLPIAEINVNGEAFFAGNHALALENLPADLVSRIKVYDKRSEMEKFMGIKTGEENYVLDLQTKKEFNGTLMTSVAAGKGNNKKKEAELISNFFKTGGENLSVIAKSGNRNMTSANKDNRQDNVAVNFLKKFGKKIHLNGNVMYSNAINGNEGTSYYEQYLKTGNRYRYATSDRHNTNRMASTMLSMKWNIDKMTLLNLSGSFSAMKGTNGSDSRQATYNENPELDITAPFNGEENGQTENDIRVNGIRMNSRSTSANRQYFLNADLTRRLNEKGSSLGLTMQYSEGRGKNEAFSVSSTTYYQLQDEWGNDSVLYRNQYYDSPNRNRKFSLGLILTQPLHKSLRAQLSYKFRRENQNNDRNTYDLSRFFDGTDDEPLYTLPEGYEAAYTDSLSNRSRSHTTAHEVALHLNYTDRTWEINAGLSVVPERQSLDQKTGRMQADTLRTSVNYYPAVTVLWHKRNTGATKLRGRHETAGTDRTADTDRQQRSAEHYTGKSQPAPFVQPKGALRSTRHEDRFERRHDLGEHGEQCDTGCDVQYPNRRYRKLSRECERELERKSHRAIPEAHQTPIFRYRTYRRFVQPERKPYQRGTAGDAGAQYDPQHDTECQPAFWLPAPMGRFRPDG